jgi:hypothetical protein
VSAPVQLAGQPIVKTSKRKRKPLSKTTRFEVLKRDKFTCQYCGGNAPDILLHVDHIHPYAKGGTNDIINLITSCVGCNLGKSDRQLDDSSVLVKQRAQIEELERRREQLEMMSEWKIGLLDLTSHAVNTVAEFWSRVAVGWRLNASGLDDIRKLLSKFSADSVMDAMSISVANYAEIRDGVATAESVQKALDYVPRILRVQKIEAAKPHIRDLYYARGIARKRCSYFDDVKAIILLEKAYAAGVTTEYLKELSCEAGSWTQWTISIHNSINDLPSKSGAL